MRTVNRLPRAVQAALLLLVLGVGLPPVAAQVPGGIRPDVQVVIMPHPSGQWVVSAVYPKEVSKATMQAHLRRLRDVSGWKLGDVEYEARGLQKNDGDFSGVKPGKGLNYKQLKPGPRDPVMSSATFVTGSPIVNWQDATLPVEPFARAFRDLKRVYVTFFVPGEFRFRGLRRHSDANLEVALTAREGAYTYALEIKNPNLGALGLPRFQVEPPREAIRTTQDTGMEGTQARRIVGMGLVVLLAAGVGLFVYSWAHRWVGR